jgi:dsDNA-specific endonuclease/ATPase MutS2
MDDNKVAVLIENLMSQFRTFGEGLDGLRDEMKEFRGETSNRLNNLEQELISLKAENHRDHKQIIQAVQDLDSEVKRLDTEVIQIKRVK